MVSRYTKSMVTNTGELIDIMASRFNLNHCSIISSEKILVTRPLKLIMSHLDMLISIVSIFKLILIIFTRPDNFYPSKASKYDLKEIFLLILKYIFCKYSISSYKSILTTHNNSSTNLKTMFQNIIV